MNALRSERLEHESTEIEGVLQVATSLTSLLQTVTFPVHHSGCFLTTAEFNLREDYFYRKQESPLSTQTGFSPPGKLITPQMLNIGKKRGYKTFI